VEITTEEIASIENASTRTTTHGAQPRGRIRIKESWWQSISADEHRFARINTSPRMATNTTGTKAILDLDPRRTTIAVNPNEADR
jgi:hypothetical protein